MVLTRSPKVATSGNMAKLTKRVVDAAGGSASATIIWDNEVKGFGLRVAPGGTKSYILFYRAGHGRNAPQHRITIGKHGSPWTPELARREARRLLGAIAAGEDPAAARKTEARTITLNALCELYLAEGTSHKKPATLKGDHGRIKNHIVPLLGSARIDRITRIDVERVMRDVAAGRTAVPAPQHPHHGRRAQGGRGAALQALAVLGAVMSFAVARGLIDNNPARGVKKLPVRRMERFLSQSELSRLGEALDAEAKATGDPYPAAAIRLLLLTGCRRSEILGLRWEWIDFERAMIFLPDSKTGRKPVYLNAPALDVLAHLPRQPGNLHAICGRRDGSAYAGLHRVWHRVRTAAELPGVRLHDLRHSFASIGAAGNNSLLILGKLLGHRHAATTERYSHLSADPMRAAAEAIGQRIKMALDGESGAGGANVRRLREHVTGRV
jgi:integrase